MNNTNNLPTKYGNRQVAIHSQPIMPTMPSMEELTHLMNICHHLGQTTFYQKLGPGGVLAIWLTARELRLPPMMCLNGGLHNVEGKVQMSANLMNMMIKNAGHDVKVMYSNKKGCRLKFIRNFRDGRPPEEDEFEFNESDAMDAQVFGVRHPNGTYDPKPKANWMKFPRPMYYARAMSGGGKMFMSDVLMNVYAFGEIYDVEDRYIESEASYVEQEVKETPPGKEETTATIIGQDASAPQAPEPPRKPSETEITAFKEAFGIGTGSKHEKYLAAVAEKCKKPQDEMIILASMNRDGFVEAFEKWESDINKKSKPVETPVTTGTEA